MLTIMVVDVEAHYPKTKREGGTIWEELHETIYGERRYGATDLEGHRWLFSQHARDVNPESWGATVASWPNCVNSRLTQGECVPVSSAIRQPEILLKTCWISFGVVGTLCSRITLPVSSKMQ
jgi:hypothetical protein